MCIVSENESQFPLYFVKCVCRINRIPRGKGLGGKRLGLAEIGGKLFKQPYEKLIVQLLHEGGIMKSRKGGGGKYTESIKKKTG